MKQTAKLDELKVQEQEAKLKYDTMLANINTIEKNKTDIKIFKESIESKSMALYPELYQDRIILEVNKLLNESGIKGNISFSEVTVSPVEKYFSEEDGNEVEPSLKGAADEINQLNGSEVRNEGNSESQDTEQSQAGKTSEGPLVEQMKVTISFTGTYANTSKFIQLVSDYARLVVMPTIAISASGEESVSGSIDLEFYSIPKISEEDSEYLKWIVDGTYGKENPFLEGSIGIKTSGNKEDDGYDVIMSVRGANSDLPSVTLGKANDSTRDTYIFFDKNEKVDVNIEIAEEGGRFYVKYKMLDSRYPSNYKDKGVEVNPGDGKIQIAVYSTTRLNIEDKVTVNLTVTSNTTEKITLVTVMDDDKTNPRLNINVKGNVEYVIK